MTAPLTLDEQAACEILISMPRAPEGRVAECVDDYIAYGRTLSAEDHEAIDARATAKRAARSLSSAVADAFAAEVEGRTLIEYSAREIFAITDAFASAGIAREQVGAVVTTRSRAIEIQALMRAGRARTEAA